MDIYQVAAQYRKQLLALEAQTVDDIIRLYIPTYRKLSEQLAATTAEITRLKAKKGWAPQRLLRELSTLPALLAQIEREVQVYGQGAHAATKAAIAQSIGMAHLNLQGMASTLAPTVTLNVSGFSSEAVAQVAALSADGTPLAELYATFGKDAAAGARLAIFEGVVAGKGAREIGRDVRASLGVPTYRAMRIARTETLRAYREASLQDYKDNADYIEGWLWVASLSLRTCASCLAMHGTQHPLSEQFGSHVQCRCTTVPIFEGEDHDLEPGPEWFAKQSEEDRESILGKGKAAAYDAGEITLRDLSVTRKSAKWGPQRYEGSLKQALQNHAERQAKFDALKALNTIEWKPTMTKEEAAVWSLGSRVPPLLHGTSNDAADAIVTGGFRVDARERNGRVYGDGVYSAEETERGLHDVRYYGAGGKRLELRSNATKLVELNDHNVPHAMNEAAAKLVADYGATVDSILGAFVTGHGDEFTTVFKAWEASKGDTTPMGEVYRQFMLSKGYEGMHVTNDTGKSWYIFYDPQSVTVVGVNDAAGY